MWCHLCKLDFSNYETFKCHVMDKHKSTKDFYEEDSNSDKSEENSVEIPDDFDLDSDIEDDNEVKEEKVIELNPHESLDSPVDSPTKTETRYTLRKRKSTSLELSTSPCSVKRLSPVIMNSESINDDQADICSSVLDQNTQNPSGQEITYVIPPSFLPNITGDLSSTTKETLKWLRINQSICNNMKYPLPADTFEKLRLVQKGICTQYCMSPSRNMLTEAVLKVYEDITQRIAQHIRSCNDKIP